MLSVSPPFDEGPGTGPRDSARGPPIVFKSSRKAASRKGSSNDSNEQAARPEPAGKAGASSPAIEDSDKMGNGARLSEADDRRSGSDKALAFFLRFLKAPKQIGSVVPSSCFLERRLVRAASVTRARMVVELGPGTGGTTQAILKALPDDARLLAIEIDPRFVDMVKSDISDPRLIAHEGSAEHIAATLSQYALPAPDVVVSGIPFSTMPKQLGENILRAVLRSLAPGGRFVAYQLRDRVAVLGRDIFGAAEIDIELLNIPPMRVFCWRKPD